MLGRQLLRAECVRGHDLVRQTETGIQNNQSNSTACTQPIISIFGVTIPVLYVDKVIQKNKIVEKDKAARRERGGKKGMY
jgi:hypothetical protein